MVNKPPISGPSATAIAAAAATAPYARGRWDLSKLLATSATMAGMISAAPIPSSPDQPIISTVRLGDSEVVSEPAP